MALKNKMQKTRMSALVINTNSTCKFSMKTNRIRYFRLGRNAIMAK